MVDGPLVGVEVSALTQGVTFLYAQAGELLKRRREAKDRAIQAAQDERIAAASDPGPAIEPPGDVFVPATPPHARPVSAVLDQLSGALLDARRNVEDYVLGSAELDPRSVPALEVVDRLRRVLEQVYSTSLTFQGERRDAAREATTQVDARHVGVQVVGAVHGDVAQTMTKYGLG
jgi:hypothetical protein